MAIDKLNFSGINSGSELVSPIGSLADRLMKYGTTMVAQGNEDERLKLQQERDAYQKGRDAITDARLNKQEARQDREQAANDLFYTEFAKGQQNKGGMYGDLITNESNKYVLNDSEIGLSTQYKNDPLLARAAGQNALADKLDWQLKAGDAGRVGRFVNSNVDDETRPEMYDRIGSLISSKGYTPPKELIIAADQARLAERTTEEAKAKLLDEQRADIIKNQKADAKFLINASGNNGSSTVYDVDGNEVQVNKGTASTINREYDKDVKNIGDASKTIRESVTALEGIKPEDKASALSQANRAVDILVKRGVPIDVAAETVTGELTSGSKKGWFTWGKEPVFNDKAIEEHANFVVKNLPKEPVLTSGSQGINKFDLAKEYVAGSNEDSKLELAKINADRAKLLLTPEERRNEKATQWLEREGILGKSSSEPGVVTSVDLSKYKDFNMDRYANKAIGVESSGNSKAQSPGGGSYYGLGQLNKESVEAMGINWNDYKNNPETQVVAFKNFTAKNVKDLESNGIPVNDFTVYIAHNQGVSGAKQILSGNTPSKQVMLNMLNQGIDNTLPKIPKGKPGAGQIDINAVMADKTITADYLNKEYAPVDNYLRKFSKKFDTEIDKVITPGSTRLDVKGQGDQGYNVTPNRLDQNKENAKAYMSMNAEQRKELADFSMKDGVTPEDVSALRSQILERNNSNKIQNLIIGSEQKDRLADNKVLETYADKKLKQDAELSKSAFSRTFGAKEEVGKYGKIWNELDNKKGSSLSKNVATLSNALDKDGFSSFEEVNKLYNSMPSGVDKDAVGELLNYKGMQGSQDWRDMKARQQYLEAGLTAASAIPIPAGLIARGLGFGASKVAAPIAERVVAPIVSGTVEKTAPLQIASDRAKLLLPDLNVGRGNSTVNNGLSLPNYQMGSRQWSNPNSVVTTDKMFGRGVSDVIEMSAPEKRAIQAQRQAIANKKSLKETIPTNISDLNYFGKEALFRNIQIADQRLKEFVNSGGKLSTKEGKRLKEEADKALSDYNKKYFYK